MATHFIVRSNRIGHHLHNYSLESHLHKTPANRTHGYYFSLFRNQDLSVLRPNRKQLQQVFLNPAPGETDVRQMLPKSHRC